MEISKLKYLLRNVVIENYSLHIYSTAASRQYWQIINSFFNTNVMKPVECWINRSHAFIKTDWTLHGSTCSLFTVLEIRRKNGTRIPLEHSEYVHLNLTFFFWIENIFKTEIIKIIHMCRHIRWPSFSRRKDSWLFWAQPGIDVHALCVTFFIIFYIDEE